MVVGLSAALSAKLTGASFYYHCMDIHPEIGSLSGEFRNPIIFRFLWYLDTITCSIAKRVIVLSEDMKRSLLERPAYKDDNIHVINNFSMPHHGEVKNIDSSLFKDPGKFRVIFAGNIGRFQGLEAFVDAMEMLIHLPLIELLFVGEGYALEALKERANNAKNVRFFPHQSVSVARKIIADADLGIVSLNSDIYRYAYPSKTMTYLEEGCPILVSVEQNSEIVNFVKSANVGLWVEPNQPQSIAAAIESIYHDNDRHQKMKNSAREVSDEIFSDSAVIKKWVDIVKEVSG